MTLLVDVEIGNASFQVPWHAAGFDGTSALALVYKCGNDMEICMPDNSIFARLQACGVVEISTDGQL